MPKKYQEEIEEILRRAGEAEPSGQAHGPERHSEDQPREHRSPVGFIGSRRGPTADYRPSSRRFTINPGKLMLAGVITLLIGIKLSPLVWVGLAMLAGAYLMHFISRKSGRYEKRWRGRSMDDAPEADQDTFKHRRNG